MKKNLLLLLAMFTFGLSANAQDNKAEIDFNRFSIEANGGIVKPTTPMANGYYTSRVSPLHLDLGVRYMFNPKFGLRAQVGYDQFENDDNSLPFESKYMNVNLQGVANLGRIMNFESWTQVLNLQFHTGVGYAQLRSEDFFDGNDQMINFITGFTGQVKLSNRISLNGDFSMINNLKQSYSFDGSMKNPDVRGFNGTMYTASVGIAVSLGKYDKHADWTFDNPAKDNSELTARVDSLETMLIDTDSDGVPDYLDLENNSISGSVVDSKGRSTDSNGNGIQDELENYVQQELASNSGKTNDSNANNANSDKTAIDLINGGYISVFFDFNSTTPLASSSQNIAFILNYLKNNPSANAEIVGHADEIGSVEVNNTISENRAQNVKSTLVKAGISESRLKIVSAGEDTSVDKNSDDARRLVRRVTFKIQ